MKHGRKIQQGSQQILFDILDFLDHTYFVEEQVENGATLGVEQIKNEQIGGVITGGEYKHQETSKNIEIKIFGLKEVVNNSYDLPLLVEHDLRRFVEGLMNVGGTVVDDRMTVVQYGRKTVETSICDTITECRSSIQHSNNNDMNVCQGDLLTLDLNTGSQNLEYKSWCDDDSQVSVPCCSNQDILELQYLVHDLMELTMTKVVRQTMSQQHLKIGMEELLDMLEDGHIEAEMMEHQARGLHTPDVVVCHQEKTSSAVLAVPVLKGKKLEVLC
jgi:hypothetical protein